jgi:hypothetical protein
MGKWSRIVEVPFTQKCRITRHAMPSATDRLANFPIKISHEAPSVVAAPCPIIFSSGKFTFNANAGPPGQPIPPAHF